MRAQPVRRGAESPPVGRPVEAARPAEPPHAEPAKVRPVEAAPHPRAEPPKDAREDKRGERER